MERREIEALVRPNIRAIVPYSTARDEYQGTIGIFMDANECPYPTGFNRYPDPHQKALKSKIGSLKGIDEKRIFIGNGTDEAIDLIFRIFCTPGVDNMVTVSPSYGMYPIMARANDVEVREVPLDRFFALPDQEVLDACDSNTKVIFLCSPNNPSGNAFPIERLKLIARSFKGILVVDEAYVDFSSQPSLLTCLDKYPNLIVLQTFSKAWGLAGLRLGMVFADEYIIRLLSNIKCPFNVNSYTQSVVLEALSNPKPVDERIAVIKSERDRLILELTRLRCVRRAFNSDANFILMKVDGPDALYEYLLNREIIVRNRCRIPGCEGCLRVTVGTPDENDRFLAAMHDYEEGSLY